MITKSTYSYLDACWIYYIVRWDSIVELEVGDAELSFQSKVCLVELYHQVPYFLYLKIFITGFKHNFSVVKFYKNVSQI